MGYDYKYNKNEISAMKNAIITFLLAGHDGIQHNKIDGDDTEELEAIIQIMHNKKRSITSG
ncbi:hypothetical protein CC1G_15175 [Coprinopsis cinerea okayama7|uniref:Uncharacterized protein n=1 Tax=Coprinopsis cinerea (strain Okayama-7 / 130 / ATCC MYA-4618 / FGSC 9003) TaxID=240176 RepID=D6RPI4_COPC7|nr:hypothetical protein CC1G_15175 [Coprinopsis cinerea okayama7\|eukprot:XP_002910536.1 hypothetical protein CC1G_15175 [Coprinopsis cinerea okayama7\